jgi:hypothetical protein
MSQRERIVRYLLGEQTEEEKQRTEQEYFAAGDFLSAVQVVCDELIDDYLRGNLAAHRHAQFAQRLQALPYLRERVETSRALAVWANAAAPLPQRRGWAGSLWTQLTTLWWRPSAATALVLCGVLAAVYWYGQRTTEPPPTLAQRPAVTPAAPVPAPTISPLASPAASPAPKPAPVNRAAVLASLLLSADQVRGREEAALLILPPGNGLVRLQLELPDDERRGYDVRLETAAQQVIKTWHRLAPVRYGTAGVIELRLPTTLLAPGEYVAKLRPTKAAANTARDFRFRVEEK